MRRRPSGLSELQKFLLGMTIVMYAIAELIDVARELGKAGGQRYFIQQFNPDTVLDEALSAVRPFPSGLLEDAAEACSKFLPTKARGRL